MPNVNSTNLRFWMAQNAQREFNESKFLDGFRGDVEMECKLAQVCG
jgi:hypothetical protein